MDNTYATNTAAIPVYLALGSNLGDRMANLEAAIALLAPHMQIGARSPVYETAPAYVTNQPSFFNLVLRASTTLGPYDLLGVLKQIEERVGRTASVRYGPRVVDLDILLYGDLQLHTGELVIPHPRMAERTFVLVPLADLAPDLVLPGQGDPVAVLATRAQHGTIMRVVGHVSSN